MQRNMNRVQHGLVSRRVWKRQGALVLLAFTISVFSIDLDRAFGQGGIPQVIQVESGLEFDGKQFPVSGVSELLVEVSPNVRTSIRVVDEGLRWVFINDGRIRNIAESNRVESEFTVWQRVHPTKIPGAGQLIEATPFNDLGHRILTARIDKSKPPQSYVQGITKITPRYVVLDSLVGRKNIPRSFEMSVGLNMISPDVLRSVLRSQITNPDNAQEHLQIVDFFVQAQQFEKAYEELHLLQQKFPDLAERFKEDRRIVRQQNASQVIREMRAQVGFGQTELTKLWSENYNDEGVAFQLIAERQEIVDGIKAGEEKVSSTRIQVQELIAEAEKDQALTLDNDQKTALQQFRDELETELSLSTVPRLDSYLIQANDASQSTLQKLSLAMSGWLLGSNNSIDNFAVTQSMFVVRDLVLKFLTSDDEAERAQILKKIVSFEAGIPDFVASMLKQMKPIEYDEAVKGYTGEKPIEFFVEFDGPKARPEKLKFKCLAHLPAEFDPYRKYPLLISLAGAQPVEKQIDFFTGGFFPKLNNSRIGPATRNGTIVVAVEWRLPSEKRSRYGYSARDHRTVLEALRSSLRKFPVDTDRVFLQGYGVGADVAYDVGLSHPEHWEGIIGISGEIQRYALRHAEDKGVPLAIYSVVGQKDIASIRGSKDAWNKWLRSKQLHDCTLSMYLGRLDETFFDDIPNMFKWMQVQKRKLPDRNGFEFECRSMRPWVNYFWFFELHGFPLQNTSWPATWSERGHKPLKFNCEIRAAVPGQPNLPTRFKLGPSNAGTGATLWLAPEYFDFKKTIEISGRGNFKGSVKASTAVILNDVRRRCDRQHPFWARLDSVGSKWMVRDK